MVEDCPQENENFQIRGGQERENSHYNSNASKTVKTTAQLDQYMHDHPLSQDIYSPVF